MNEQSHQNSEIANAAGPERVLTTVRRAARFARGLLRAVAGAPAGVERSRRGSFLVLVVATLALMSVFAVVYVTIGKTDAGTQRGVVKGESRDDVPNQFADYVSQIVADDVFATINLGVDNKSNPLNIRESTDFPGANWTDRSDSTDPDTSFNPVGTYTGQWTGAGVDPRGASDPFLAASEPTFLGFADDATTRVAFDKVRDWAAISNVAPDGRFVNLHNLRNNFDATPQQMQLKLTLLDDNGKPTNQTDFGVVLDFNTPAHLTNRQRGLFRPANTFLLGDPNGQKPDDPNYLDYHYADTDGDGFYDARWCELVDAHDLSNIKNLLRTDDGLRYFFAVRIEDLSGRANVLTAMDLVGAPTDDPKDTIGLAPEVDLRRILSLADPLSDDPNDPKLKLGYAALQQPDSKLDPQAKLVENYSKYLPGFSAEMSLRVGAQAYHALHNTDALRKPLGAIHTALIAPPITEVSPSTAFAYALPADRADLYTEQLGLGRGLSSKAGVSVGAISSIEDLAELLTYRGVNDPTVTSQLELIFGGRFREKLPAQDPDRETVRFSPLRDNRPLSLERDVDNRDGDVSVGKPDGKADSDAMIRSAFDVRQRLTTVSGARPIMPTRVTVPMSQDQISAADLRREISTDANSLYGIYADTLIPDSAADLAWKNDSTQLFDAVRFTNYGAASAELGARISAHLAVNLRAAMADKGSTSPIAYTVLLDEKFREDLDKDWQDKINLTGKQISSRDQKWAWWVERGASTGAQTGALDVGIDWRESGNAAKRKDSRLGDSDTTFGGDKLESKAINVYGITPQPVLTAAAAFHVYTDIPTKATAAPYGFSGDQEWDGTGEDGDPYKSKHITIDPRVLEGNDDFLMQVVAFQLSNPFDATIYLTQDGKAEGATLPQNDRFEYYVEFAGRYFRLANLDSTTSTLTAASLSPGETRVFYALCLPLESTSATSDIISRWNKTKESFTADQVRTWLDKQMGDQLTSGFKPPALVEEFDPNTGKSKASTTFTNLVELPTSGGLSKDPTLASVRLWRRLRTASPSTGPLNESPKDLQNDPMPPQVLDNDLLVDRLRDPKFDPSTPGSSTFLPHLESLTGSNNAEIPGTDGGPDNVASEDPLDNTGFSITRFGVVRRNADPDNASGFDPKTDGVPAYMLEGKWTGSLKNKTLAGPTSISRGTFDGGGNGHGFDKIMKLWTKEKDTPVLTDKELTTEPRKWSQAVIGVNKSKKKYADVRTSFITGLDKDSVRVADMLLPLGVGAEYDDAPAKFDDKYLTLGESLANALDYSSPTPPALYANLGTIPPSNQANNISQFPKLDGGHLALDRFVPFYDGNNDHIYSRTEPLDKVRGQGVPMALTIFDRAETIRADKVAWGVDRPINGRVNVNTASKTVLRSVGMLTPTPVTGDWWWTGANFDNRSDIASTIVAYRDKLISWPRVSSPTPDSKAIDFRDDDGTAQKVKPSEFDKLNGRYNAAGVESLREAPGIASLGELMLARSLDPSQPADNNPWRNNPNNIDFMGYNKATDFHKGVSVGVDPSTKMKDSFVERLQVAASASNALSTRSDFFAVWFIVRGYRPSDVTGLSQNDPMVPSVQRRFVMVLDRSNVVKYGQKPRILLLKEVPF